MIIAFAGKGGVGKSTIASQVVRRLSGRGSVLAVDADPNSNLSDKLGMEVKGTIGGLRDETVAYPEKIPAGMSKQQYVSEQVQRIITEYGNTDLLVMGRPEGEGCYCFINSSLKECFGRVFPYYDYVVVDNEAGMEHMSRKVLPHADVFLFISDPTVTGVKTAGRLSDLAEDVGIVMDRKILIINNVSSELPDRLNQTAEESGFSEVMTFPYERYISESAMETEELNVPEDSEFGKAITELLELIV